MKMNYSNDGWRFIFNNSTFFVVVLSDLYEINHPRYIQQGNFILFQSENSFHSKIPRSEKEKIKELVREIFRRKNMDYTTLIDGSIEAQRYILPKKIGDKFINWWI